MTKVDKPLCDALRIRASWLAAVAWTLALLTLGNVGSSRVDAALLRTATHRSASDDEILLVSTRAMGTVCDSQVMEHKLQCERYERDASGKPHWSPFDWHEILADHSDQRLTVFYVHGNRIARGQDRVRGLMIYHSLITRGKPTRPLRLIIWSWPSARIRGPIKDYKVKAARTRPVGWQLAWFLDRMPEETPLALIGYSYGARVVSGAMHLLGGGTLSGLRLEERIHPARPQAHVALLAAALDAPWVQPGGYHGREFSQIDRMVLSTNRLDPAMRFYHLSNGPGRIDPLGKSGVPRPSALGAARQKLQRVDFTQAVGRSHLLSDYLAASGKISLVWRRLLADKGQQPRKSSSSLVGHRSVSQRK